MTTALKICIRFSLLCIPFCLYLGEIEDFNFFVMGLFMILFLGACVVPTCYGIMISCVQRQYQNSASSLGQIFFNIFGYFMAPIASGYVIDLYEDPLVGLRWGFKLILWTNCIAVFFLIIALFVAIDREDKALARRQARAISVEDEEGRKLKGDDSEPASTGSYIDYSKGEILAESKRRRIKSFQYVAGI